MRENGRTHHFAEHRTDHARNMNVISTMMHKMIRDALLFSSPLQAYFPLAGILPSIAHDVAVMMATTGLLVTVFTLTYALGQERSLQAAPIS
jgi:hypothetical protein